MNVGCYEYADVKVDRLQLVMKQTSRNTKNHNFFHFFMVSLDLKAGSCVSHFNVSLTVWAKSQDGVHKPQFLKRRERTAEADRTKVRLFTSQALYR